MKRSSVARIPCVRLGLIVASFAAFFAAPAGAAEMPNVIFVMADDLGYADLGCYGQKRIRTPEIDKLAKEGMRFTDCYSGAPVCAPARSVLMTGQHTGHTTVRWNTRTPLKREDITVAQILKEAGYVTGATGKWGLGKNGSTGAPRAKGFDEWFGYLDQKRAHNHYAKFLWRNEEQVKFKEKTYSHDLFTDFALEFIKKHRNRPFFLYVPYCIPHQNFQVPSFDPYTKRQFGRGSATAYAAMVTRMDRDVGRIMALLKELDLDDNTIVFFCSDNGAAVRFDGVFDSCGPLKGQKRDLTEGGIRVPMIVRWPEKIEAGVESDVPWYFADVLPTLAELAGAEIPSAVDGVSVAPLLLGREHKLRDRFLYWEKAAGSIQAVRWHKWKAIRDNANGTFELYDVAKDLGETTNVANDNPEVVARIAAYLKTARSPQEPGRKR